MNFIGFRLLAVVLVITSSASSTKYPPSTRIKKNHSGCNPRNFFPVYSTQDLIKKYPTLNNRLKDILIEEERGKIFYNRRNCLPKACYREFYLDQMNRSNPYRIVALCARTRTIYLTENHYETFIRIKHQILPRNRYGSNDLRLKLQKRS